MASQPSPRMRSTQWRDLVMFCAGMTVFIHEEFGRVTADPVMIFASIAMMSGPAALHSLALALSYTLGGKSAPETPEVSPPITDTPSSRPASLSPQSERS